MGTIPCESCCKNYCSSYFETLTTFEDATTDIKEKLLETDDYWVDVPRPEPLVWRKIPLVVQEKMLEEVNDKLANDRAVANLELLKFRFQPILQNKSSKFTARPIALVYIDATEKPPPSQPADPPAAKPHPQPAESPDAGRSSPADPPGPGNSRPSGFWDPVAEARRGG